MHDEDYHARMLAHEKELERRADGTPPALSQNTPSSTVTAAHAKPQKNTGPAKRIGWFLFRSFFFSFVGFALSAWIFNTICGVLLPFWRHYPLFNAVTVIGWILFWAWLWFRNRRQ